MSENSSFAGTARNIWRDMTIVAGFLTRLPISGERPAVEQVGEAARAFPLVGACIGLLGGMILVVTASLGVPMLAAALLALGVQCLLTGALHEDGLADVADGFGGGRDAEDRLRIMRDSRVGSFGALALILSVGLRAVLLAAFLDPLAAAGAMIAAAAVSRGALPYIHRSFPLARTDGMAVSIGVPPNDAAVTAALLGALFVLLFLGPWGGIVALLLAAAFALSMAKFAVHRIGGITGDVLGTVQQLVEVAILLTAASMA